MDEALFYFGDTLKALDDKGRVGGYAVRFTDAEHRDLTGEYFTKNTYLGAHAGDGVDVLFNHGFMMPLPEKASASQKKTFQAFSDHIYGTTKSTRDDIGLHTEVVLNLADEYEAAIFGLVKLRKLGWSSASAGHTVRKSADGEITRWPIIEISLTPTPAEPLNRVVTVKTIQSLKSVPLDDDADDDFDEKPMSEEEKLVSSFKTLDISTHSQLAVSVLRDFTSRIRSRYEARLRDGRVLSETYCQRWTSVLEQWKAVSADLQAIEALLDKSATAMDDAEKRAKEIEYFKMKYRYDRR